MRKYWIMLVALVLVAGSIQAQEEKVVEKSSKKEARQLKRAENKRVFEINKAYAMNLIEERDFVLQADQLSGKNSMPIIVDKGVNFIKIEGDNMVIQYGLFSRVGLNGLGGLTLQGRINQIEAKDQGEGKPYNVRIQFYTPSLNGVATVNINVRGGRARASLWSNGRLINFDGEYGANAETIVAQSTNSQVLLAY